MAASQLKVAGVILAAGFGQRMGTVKSLLPFGGTTLLETVLNNARRSKLTNIIVVLGYASEKIRRKVQFHGCVVVVNNDYSKGQSSSLQAGIGALPKDTAGVMFLLGDQPFIDAQLIDNLIAGFRERSRRILLPTCDGQRGNPAVVPRHVFSSIAGITGDTGLRVLFPQLQGQVWEMETGDPGILLDIDTMEDYQRLLLLQQERQGKEP
jgi:molybdenum cofactor cytidylyltransferase